MSGARMEGLRAAWDRALVPPGEAPGAAPTGAVLALDAAAPAPAIEAPLEPLGWSWSRAGLLLVAVVAIALTSRQGGLSAEDATVLLNARNGFAHSPPLFYYAGYASLLPDLISWAVAGLPLVFQAASYMVLAVVGGVLLGEEAYRLLRRFQPGAVAIAGAVFLLWLTHNQSNLVFLNLTYLIWPGLLWGAFRLARAIAEEKAPGWGASALLLALGLSQPLAAAWAPALAWIAWRSKAAPRWRMAALLALIAAYDLAAVLLAPHTTAGVVPLAQAWQEFLAGEAHAGPRDLLVHLVGLAVAAGAAWMALQAARSGLKLDRRDRALLHLLIFAALATALYLVSDRFQLYRTLVERYGLAALVGGAAAGFVAGAGRLRGRGAAIACGLLLLLPAANLVRGHLGRQVGELGARLAFLREAEAWRSGCQGAPAARMQEARDRWSLVVPCRRWPPATVQGFYTAAPDGSLAYSAEMSLDTAGVYAGQAVGARRKAP